MTDETMQPDPQPAGPAALRMAVAALGIALVGFQLYTAGFGQFPPLIQRAAHVALGLLLVYLGFAQLAAARLEGARRGLAMAVSFGAATFALLAGGYIVANEVRITESFGIIARPEEMVLATGLTLLVLEAARRTTGLALPILAVAMILYALLGEAIPGYWGHTGFSPIFVVEHLYLGTEGIWGTVTGLSANLIAIFIIFGSILLATGAARSFMDIAILVAGRFPGGAAKVATFASALFGMLNGAAVANVATTGNFTIPAMKRLGYRPAFAGAVEATASSGGQITPPIMGAGAFVMAELLGVPYLTIVYAAVIPAFLFFACVWIAVDIEARRENMQPFAAEDMPDPREVFSVWRIGPLALTLIVTLGALFSGYTPSLAAFYGIVTNVALYICVGSWRRDALHERLSSLLEGAQMAAASIVSVLALLVCAQIALSLIGLTGVGIKLSETIIAAEQTGGLLLGAMLAMIVALVLGMGMPTTAAYLLAAAVAAPALIALGVEPLVAHFFVFYSALLSALTPPVCTAVFTAAVIARTHWWPICLASMRLAAMKYVLPFYFIFRQETLLRGSWAEIAWVVVMGIVASFLLAVGMAGFYRRHLPLAASVALVVLGAAIASGRLWVDAAAILVAGALIVWHRQAAPEPAAAAAIRSEGR